MTFYLPKHVSEREPGIDEDCVWCSGVMFANAVTHGRYPATLAEAEALRAASGDSMADGDGSSIGNLSVGLVRRYGWGYEESAYLQRDLVSGLTPGRCAVVLGHIQNTPAGSPFRRFIPTYTGGHAVFIANIGTGYWLMDPEGPIDGSYQGEFVPLDHIQAFYDGMGAALDTIGRLVPPETTTEDPLSVLPIELEELRTIRIPAGADVLDLNGQLIRTLDAPKERLALHRMSIGSAHLYAVRLPHGDATELLLVRAGQVEAIPVQMISPADLQAAKDAAAAAQAAAAAAQAAATAATARATAASAAKTAAEARVAKLKSLEVSHQSAVKAV